MAVMAEDEMATWVPPRAPCHSTSLPWALKPTEHWLVAPSANWIPLLLVKETWEVLDRLLPVVVAEAALALPDRCLLA